MRGLAVTLLACVGMGAAAAGAGWSIEASALPRPPRADLAAADALVVLDQHRVVDSSLRIDSGPVLHAQCRRGWFFEGDRLRRGSLLTPTRGVPVFDTGAHQVISQRATAELNLAGCPPVLSATIGRLLQNAASIRGERAWLGRPVLALRFRDKRALLTLYVTPKRFVPVGVALQGIHVSGSSRIRFPR